MPNSSSRILGERLNPYFFHLSFPLLPNLHVDAHDFDSHTGCSFFSTMKRGSVILSRSDVATIWFRQQWAKKSGMVIRSGVGEEYK
ncbi:hypothetical protein DITRI_Ditri07aG0018000 [Diplodiscus trichospermus]